MASFVLKFVKSFEENTTVSDNIADNSVVR